MSKLLSIALLIIITSCDAHEDPSSPKADTDTLIRQYASGKGLFQRYCRVCHNLYGTDELIFEGVFDRMPKPSEEYFIRYITDSRSLKESGDQYAIQLDKRWGENGYEHLFKDSMSRQEIQDMIMYIRIVKKDKD